MCFLIFVYFKEQKFSFVIVVFQGVVRFEDSMYNSDRRSKYFLIQEEKHVFVGRGEGAKGLVCCVSLLQELLLLEQPAFPSSREAILESCSSAPWLIPGCF